MVEREREGESNRDKGRKDTEGEREVSEREKRGNGREKTI
jgi:hypothetical protein